MSQDQSTYTINDFKPENVGWYRLIVGQAGSLNGTVNYDCLALSASRKLIYSGRSQFCMNRVQNFTVFLPDATSYTKWDFGDGKGEIKNTDVSSNEQTQSYAYTKSGTYIITVRSYDASDILLKEERFEKRVLPCLIPVNPNIHIWKE